MDPNECKALVVAGLNQSSHEFALAGRGRAARGRRGRSGSGRSGRGFKQCTFWGRSKHIENVCYCKPGFPPHMKDNGRESVVNNVTIGTTDEVNEKFSKSAGIVNGSSEVNFSTEQKLALLALLDQQRSTSTTHNVNQVLTLPSTPVRYRIVSPRK
ncbi:hypothetical protein S245_063089 [Arachis hypogaea]